jgi:3-phenylpropionate/trans-cinnamate dioxygenase ferredoxin subunit
MVYSKVAQVSELPEGGKKLVTLDGNDILLIRFEGSFYAVENKCPHMGGSLFEGNLDGQYVNCPTHGSVFDIKNGSVHQSGKLLLFKVSPRDLKRYPVKIEGDDLLIGTE